MIKKALTVILSFTLVGSLAACGSGSKGTAGSGKEPLKIGVTLPTSGAAALSGEQSLNGINLAVDMINKKGGVLGQPIQTIVYDDKANPEEGVNAIQKLITRDQVKFIVGGLQSSVTLAQLNAVRDQGILQIVIVSKAPKITEEGHDLLFRLNSSSKMDGTYFPNFIKNDVKPKTIAIVAEQTDYGKAETEVVKSAWKDGGPQIVGEEWIQLTDTDFTSQLTKIKSLNPDAVYLITSPPATISAVLTQAKELGLKAPIITSIGTLNKDIIKLAGAAANGAISADIYLNTSEDPANKEFVEAFKAKYNYMPEKYEQLSYEAIQLLAQAIEKTGKTDPAEVAKTLKAGKWTSPRGTITFDSKGQAVSDRYFPQIIKDGTIQLFGK